MGKCKNINKLAVLVPSRFRSEKLDRAIKSYVDTAVKSDIFFGFQKDDPDLKKNIQIIHKYGFKDYQLFENIGLCAKVNALCSTHPDYAAYMVLNDDQVVCTKEFDKILLDKLDELEKKHGHRLWVLHWKDGINDNNLCQSFATHELLEITGTYYPEGYMKQLYSDNWYHTLGVNCHILMYLPEIFIEHIHWCVKKAPLDNNYAWTNTIENYHKEHAELIRFLQDKGIELIYKVNQAISNKLQ